MTTSAKMMEELTRDVVGKSLSLHSFHGAPGKSTPRFLANAQAVCRSSAVRKGFSRGILLRDGPRHAYAGTWHPPRSPCLLHPSRAYPSFGLASEDTRTWQLHR